MANRVGPSFCASVSLNGRVFDASTVSDMDIMIPMNGLPRGKATVLITNVPEYRVESGCYGMIFFLNTGYPSLDGKGFSIYVLNASQTIVNEATTKLSFSWICATSDSMKRKTMAITGTSLDAMIDVLKSYEQQIPYENSLMAYDSSITDTMTWRYTNANLEDMLAYTVDHSAMNGDYMFWTYNEVAQKIQFSSLGVSRRVSTPQALIYSQNALASTNSVMYSDPNTNSRMWLYAYEERVDNSGNQLDEMFPDVVFSNVTPDGKADITKCTGSCFDNVVSKYGAMSGDEARTEYNVSDKEAVYGDLVVIDYFPLNTHKSYAIAPLLRKRIFSEYSKVMVIKVANSIGPAVGSSVVVRALKVTRNGGNGGPDMHYTDEYVVISKHIRKEGTTEVGALGNQVGNQSAEYMTTLVLGSNAKGNDGYDQATKVLNNIAEACKVELEKIK